MKHTWHRIHSLLCLTSLLILGGLDPAQVVALAPTPAELDSMPPALRRKVDFAKEVQPLLQGACVKCHARGKSKGEFNFDTREAFLKGGEHGPAIIPGNSRESHLIHLVAGLDPEMIMPEKGSKLSNEQIGLLRGWIDQGAPWPASIDFKKPPLQNLEPRSPEIPASKNSAGANPIDLFLASYYQKHKVTPSAPVSDSLFARRVWLDLIGLIPTADQLQQFEQDKDPQKRAKLATRLLADQQRYAEHWLTFWSDILRNDYRGPGYIDGGRKQITGWLYSALATNKPYDQFVRELINPTPASEGFAKGIVWRGVVNASQTPQMQAAQNISQVFMGVNLKCASCHDSFINDWSLADAYGLASVFADKPLELVHCDKPTGKTAAVKFIYNDLGSIQAEAPKSARLQQLADILTSEKNGRLSRTVVNRLWARLMGYGLVEPVDEMENPSWHPDLLDWLSQDFVKSGYNIRHLLHRIVTSQAYQLKAVDVPEGSVDSYTFRGPAIRRMSAEQFIDSLGVISGVWHRVPAGEFDFTAGKTAEELAQWLTPDTKAQWIWNSAEGSKSVPAGKVLFRRTFVLAELPSQASAIIQADDTSRFFINGKEIPPNNEFPWFDKTTLSDIRSHLVTGTNVFAVEVSNTAASPAGLLFYARIRGKNPAAQKWDVLSDASWKVVPPSTPGWINLNVQDESFPPSIALGDYGMAPWNMGKRFESAVATAAQYGRVRSALVAATPLMVAMGRPNREQVNTTRPSVATTLQTLELTNGATLAAQIKEASTLLATRYENGPRSFLEWFYRQTLSRSPQPIEEDLAQNLLANAPSYQEGVEDLLWVTLMLPDFQLIR